MLSGKAQGEIQWSLLERKVKTVLSATVQTQFLFQLVVKLQVNEFVFLLTDNTGLVFLVIYLKRKSQTEAKFST